MRKISIENLHTKNQHLNIMDMLFRYHNGLSLHELTYLLTTRKNMQKMSGLRKCFGLERKNIFKTRQRINDCLNDLKRLELIIKNEKKYELNMIATYTYECYLRNQKEIAKAVDELNKEFKELIEGFKNLNEEDINELEEEIKNLRGKNKEPLWRQI